jgi:hypothetical protein
MEEQRAFSSAEKRIKALEITHAYALYKIRLAGDLDDDLSDWVNNITRSIEKEKAEK